MDSRPWKLSSLYLRPFLLFLLFIATTATTTATLFSPSFASRSSFHASSSFSEKNDKVVLDLYYESLCPYCSNFIANDLIKIFETGLISDIDLHLIPYGNAKIGSNATITCQPRNTQNTPHSLRLCVRVVAFPPPTTTRRQLDQAPEAHAEPHSLTMASHRHRITLFLILLTSSTPISAALLSSAASPPESSDKVSVGLYYESLCPYSANFIVNYLVKIFENGLISVVDLNLVPWGNAKLRSNDTVVCQHGPSECLLNTIEACAIHVWPDLDKHFSFIYCVETLVYEHKYTQWETCFDKLDLDPTPVTECYNSGYGKELELQYAAETNALQPPHEYVPWVVVDGQPLYEDYENFMSYICKAYKGTVLPNACTDLSLSTMAKEKANPYHSVCYREAAKSTLSKIRSAIKSWMDLVEVAVSL